MVKQPATSDDNAAVSPRIAPVSVGSVREALGFDLAAGVLTVAGVALLALTGDPGWTALLLLTSMATVFGGVRPWPPLVVMVVAATGWALVLVRELVVPARPLHVVVWAAHGVALVAALALALAIRRRFDRERGETERALAFAQDVTVHDPLTGLTNRRGLALLGAQILESAHRGGDAVYCVFIDIDGLATVNEQLGHSAGDDVLLTVAEGLRRSTRATDAVARWGDDEFVVVGPGTGLAPLEMERRIRAHCLEHSSVDRDTWQARVSAGGSVLEPWDEGSIETILRLADREMRLRRALRRKSDTAASTSARIENERRRPPRGLGD